MWSSNRRGEGRSGEAFELGQILDQLAGDRPLRAGMALGELAARWDEVVGERLARECSPADIAGGVLVVRAASAGWAAQVGFLAAEIRGRAEAVIGAGAVTGVRVLVGPRGGRSKPG